MNKNLNFEGAHRSIGIESRKRLLPYSGAEIKFLRNCFLRIILTIFKYSESRR